MPPLRLLLSLLISTLLLSACAPREEQEVEIEDPDAYVDEARALLGTWVMTEQSGAMPDRIVTLTFTEQGDYILLSEVGGQERRQYHPAGHGLIEVMDAPGAPTEIYEYDVTGTTLTMTIPGTEAVSVFERRQDLLNQRPELVPDTLGPDPIEVPLPPGPPRPEDDPDLTPDQYDPVPDEARTDG